MNIIDPEAMYDMFMLLTHKVTLCDDKVSKPDHKNVVMMAGFT